MTEEFVPVHETVRYDVFLYNGEAPAENRWHFKHVGGMYSDAEAFAFAETLYLWHSTYIMPLLSNEVQSLFVIGIQLETEFGTVFDFHPSTFTTGGLDAMLPMVCCARIDFKTGLEGKWYNGHNYVPGLPRSAVIKDHIDQTWLGALREAYMTLIATAASNNWTWVVPSRRLGGLPRAEGITTPVTEVLIHDARIHTWRQRIARFGT